MIQKSLVSIATVVVLLLLPPRLGADGQAKLPSACPPRGTQVPLAKAMNPSFIGDFKGCDIVVEATFFRMGTPQGFKLGGYDVKKNTTFQVLEPGGEPQPFPMSNESSGTFAGVPKADSAILFELKSGDAILLRGAPVKLKTLFGLASIGAAVFHAETVTRRP